MQYMASKTPSSTCLKILFSESRFLIVVLYFFTPAPDPRFVKGHFILPDPSEFLLPHKSTQSKGDRFSQGGQNFVDPALLTPSTERSDIGLDYGRAGREPLGVTSSSAVLPGAQIYPHFGEFVVMSRDWDFCGDFRLVSFILDLSKLHGTKQ